LVVPRLRVSLGARGESCCGVCSAGQWEVDLCSSGVGLELQDVASALERLQGCRARAVGAPKVARPFGPTETLLSGCLYSV
jgi:hypothetical protein